jgi:hypothetical protein
MPVFKNAAILYGREAVERLEEALRLPVDNQFRPDAPWS